MKEIQEYRKASAEWMGLPNWNITISNEITYDELNKDGIPTSVKYWHPDTDANQREMIEDKLIEQGIHIDIRSIERPYRGRKWIVRFRDEAGAMLRCYGKSQPVGFHSPGLHRVSRCGTTARPFKRSGANDHGWSTSTVTGAANSWRWIHTVTPGCIDGRTRTTRLRSTAAHCCRARMVNH